MSIILRRVEVDGFKNLLECEAELHNLNILVGPNNSGKSNFLETFTYLRGLLFGSENYRKDIFANGSTPRGDSSTCHIENHLCKPVTFSFLLDHTEDKVITEIEYSLSIQSSYGFYQQLKEKKKPDFIGFISELLCYKEKTKPGKSICLFRRDKNKLEIRTKSANFSEYKIDNYTPAVQAVKLFNTDLDKFDSGLSVALLSIYELFDVNIIFASPTELRESINKGNSASFNSTRTTSFDILPAIAEIHAKPKLYTQFNNMLCQILDLENASFFSFKIPSEAKTKDMPQVVNFFNIKMRGQHSSNVRNFSDGTLMVIALLLVVFSPSRKGHLICIEEPENCLHPKALKTLITFLKKKSIDIQVLITTHSPYLLNLVSPEDVIVARVHDDGGTRFERIKNIKELHKKLRKGFINFGDLLETEFLEDEEVIF